MVDGVEEAADVRVEHPVRPLLDDDRRERVQGVVRRPPGAEAVRETQKRSFVDGLQDHAHGLLHDLVLQSRNSNRPLPPIRVRDMHPSHGKRVVAAAVDPVLQVREASFEMLAVLAPRDPIHPGCRFLLQASIRLRQKRPWVRSAFRGAGFPLASPLPSIDSAGVTRAFADFTGTMGSSDSPEACDRGLWILPSRGCLTPAMVDDEALPGSPGSLAERAKRSEPPPHAVGRCEASPPPIAVGQSEASPRPTP